MSEDLVPYYYAGWCPRTQKLWQLPRTTEVEAIARELMVELSTDGVYNLEGKMYGVLLAIDPDGERVVLKAFSGLLNGLAQIDGWVSPIPGREKSALLEAETLVKLAAIKQEIIELDRLAERGLYNQLVMEFDRHLIELNAIHHQRKLDRQAKRDRGNLNPDELSELEQLSRRDKRQKKEFKLARESQLKPLQLQIESIDNQIAALKLERKQLSRQLQQQIHANASLLNFLGTSASLQSLMPQGIPTGTGDCCAPKLLHHAATHQLQPVAMGEFWWGETKDDKISGNFYPACTARCQPLMGFMLSGASRELPPTSTYAIDRPLTILAADDRYIIISKPAGLLSVPGRYRDTQDSALTRLQREFNSTHIYAVHRLDLETSGVLLFARDRDSYRCFLRQFAERRVRKKYIAILDGILDRDEGEINLPLRADLDRRPYQIVDFDLGKPSMTKFRVIDRQHGFTQVELMPITGRTHQLRVHSTDARGLGIPIRGDRLYGNGDNKSDRLYLHAIELVICHPDDDRELTFTAPVDWVRARTIDGFHNAIPK